MLVNNKVGPNLPLIVRNKIRELTEKNSVKENIPSSEGIDFARARVKYWNDRLQVLLKERDEACTHSDVEIGATFWDGTYLNRAETQYTIRCNICDSVIFKHTEVRDYYG